VRMLAKVIKLQQRLLLMLTPQRHLAECVLMAKLIENIHVDAMVAG